jgi:hypothetical protein
VKRGFLPTSHEFLTTNYKEIIMKKLALLTMALALLGTPAAYAESGKYTQEEIGKMPQMSSIEQVRCPSAKFNSNKKRLECKQRVRIELYEKRQARESAE